MKKPTVKPAFDVINAMHKQGRTYMTLTQEGMSKKFFRIIARELQQTSPVLFEKLKNRAMEQIDRDNQNPLSLIQDAGLDMEHKTSQSLQNHIKQKRKQLKELS